MHLRNILGFLDFFNIKQAKYFKDDKQNISSANLTMIILVSISGILMLSVLILLTPFLIDGWTPTRHHFSLYITLGVFFTAALIYRISVSAPSYALVNAGSLAFCFAIIGHLIAISVFSNPSFPESLVSISFVAIPMLFSLPLSMFLSLLTVSEAVFLILTNYYKTPLCIQHDTFSSIVAIFFSLIAFLCVMRLRVTDYSVRSQYQQQSCTDPLTGILNKSAFMKACEIHLASRTAGMSNALFVIDVDDFKHVNDSLGHKTGDKVLEGMGHVMRKIFRGTDLVGRFGGDEFCVLMKDTSSSEIIDDKAYQLQKKLREVSERLIGRSVSCSIGIAVCSDRSCTYGEIFSVADSALYASKQKGKNCFTVKTIN